MSENFFDCLFLDNDFIKGNQDRDVNARDNVFFGDLKGWLRSDWRSPRSGKALLLASDRGGGLLQWCDFLFGCLSVVWFDRAGLKFFRVHPCSFEVLLVTAEGWGFVWRMWQDRKF